MPGSGRIARFYVASEDGECHGVARVSVSSDYVQLDWTPTGATDSKTVRGDQRTPAPQLMAEWITAILTGELRRTA